MSKDTKMITTGGILSAMTVVALYIASFGIGPNMAFYALCSVFISVMIFEYGIKSGLLVYLAAGIVGVLIIPDKFGIIIYGIGFGVYPVVKFLSEKIQGSLVHYVIKSLWVVVTLSLFYYITKIFFVAKIKELKYSILLTALFLVIMFFLYDYILTLILSLYERRIKRRRDIKLSK